MYSSCDPIIVFYNLLVCPLEAYVDLGQIAKLSSNTLAWCAEFGSSALVAWLFLFLLIVSQCTAGYLQFVWGGHFRVGCQVSPVVLSEYL